MQKSAETLEQYAKDLAAELTPLLTTDLHIIAAQSGWPQTLVKVLKVDLSPTLQLEVTYPEENKSEVEDMEYGTPSQLPNAAIRPFILRAPKIIEKFLEERTLPEMFKELGVW